MGVAESSCVYFLFDSYVDDGTIKDPIVLSIEDAMQSFLSLSEDILPTGFHEWRKFGAPKESPGQTSHHPGVKEHELIGWLLAMHFLAALELVSFILSLEEYDGKQIPTTTNRNSLPSPIHGSAVSPNLHSLFYGHETRTFRDDGSASWKLNSVHCRTTYDPILTNKLQDIVVGGSVGEDLDIMLPKGAQMYNSGWVLDMGESEKKAKRTLERFGGLGFVDSKKAYYGIRASGPLELFVPCDGREDIAQQMLGPQLSLPASTCFRTLVVCEVNEKHVTGQECNLDSDLSFNIGGIPVERVHPINATGTQYWGRNICISIDIPAESTLSKRHRKVDEGKLDVGLSVGISVTNIGITYRSGPCSISHFVWEQAQ